PDPISCSSVRPVKASHGSLKNVHKPSAPAIQRRTGAVLAMMRNSDSPSLAVATASVDAVWVPFTERLPGAKGHRRKEARVPEHALRRLFFGPIVHFAKTRRRT